MVKMNPVKIGDLSKFRIISDPQISPDGTKALFVHTIMVFDKNEYLNNLWFVDLATRKERPYTAGRNKDKNPRWSPEGSKILFTSIPPHKDEEEKKKPQLYVMDTTGGEAKRLTDLHSGVESPRWSPNGKNILFLSSIKENKTDSDVKIIKRLEYKFNGKGFYEGKRKHIFSIPSKGDKPKQLTKDDFDVASPEWMKDGKNIVFYSNISKDADKSREKFVYTIPANGGSLEKLIDKAMYISAIVPSPKNRNLAIVGHYFEKGLATKQDVYILPPNGVPKSLTSEFDQDIGTKLGCDLRVRTPAVNPKWSHNGEWIYFTSCYEGTAALYRVPIWQGSVEKVIGEADHSIEAFSISKENSIAYTVLNTRRPMELWLYKKKPRQVTKLNNNYLRKTMVQGHEHFNFKSNAGHIVEGWLMKPINYIEGQKYPMILHIHGGPRGAYGNSMMHEFQVLAAQGWAVMYTNPFGSGGYYEAFQAGLPGHYFEQDYADLMQAVDFVDNHYDFVDEDRLGVTGGSYGGVMTNWIITHTDRFKAAVTLRSITNWYSFFGTSDIGWTFGKQEMKGVPWRDEEKFMAKSPIRYVEKVKTPTMIIHSEEDYRCPMEQAEQFFTALKMLDIPTEFIRFPRENHDLSRSGKPEHRKERLEHLIRWFKEYL
jgi:dipeptidyl aminopeptidase/acylaminoacyl peptidase